MKNFISTSPQDKREEKKRSPSKMVTTGMLGVDRKPLPKFKKQQDEEYEALIQEAEDELAAMYPLPEEEKC